MEELIERLEEILEEEHLDTSKKFSDFDGWDSLSKLAIIVMLDENYKISISNKELSEFLSIDAFCKNILSR
jgi:acyl carrier protein